MMVEIIKKIMGHRCAPVNLKSNTFSFAVGNLED